MDLNISPLPWLVYTEDESIGTIRDAKDNVIVQTQQVPSVRMREGNEIRRNNASFIVMACNAHHDLVKATQSSLAILEQLRDKGFDVSVEIEECRVALAKTTQEQSSPD